MDLSKHAPKFGLQSSSFRIMCTWGICRPSIGRYYQLLCQPTLGQHVDWLTSSNTRPILYRHLGTLCSFDWLLLLCSSIGYSKCKIIFFSPFKGSFGGCHSFLTFQCWQHSSMSKTVFKMAEVWALSTLCQQMSRGDRNYSFKFPVGNKTAATSAKQG